MIRHKGQDLLYSVYLLAIRAERLGRFFVWPFFVLFDSPLPLPPFFLSRLQPLEAEAFAFPQNMGKNGREGMKVEKGYHSRCCIIVWCSGNQKTSSILFVLVEVRALMLARRWSREKLESHRGGWPAACARGMTDLRVCEEHTLSCEGGRPQASSTRRGSSESSPSLCVSVTCTLPSHVEVLDALLAKDAADAGQAEAPSPARSAP
jgi:hypothetical protein